MSPSKIEEIQNLDCTFILLKHPQSSNRPIESNESAEN